MHKIITRSTVLAVVVLAFVILGCDGGNAGPSDGDDVHNCPDGQVWSDTAGKCISTSTDGDVGDGDVNDGDTDGDQDLDKDFSDGDIIDPDGDLDLDGDIFADGDEERPELEFQENFEDPEDPPCECRIDRHCGSRGHCDGCYCIWDDGDNDLPCLPCETQDDCDPGTFCNLDPAMECCDYTYRPECETNDDCPVWSHCSIFNECDFSCLADEDCGEDFCCFQGECVDSTICNGGDTDGDSDEVFCNGWEECEEALGDGYYCNVDSNLCLPGECRFDAECDAQPNGLCNQHTGECVYLDGVQIMLRSGAVLTGKSDALGTITFELLGQSKINNGLGNRKSLISVSSSAGIQTALIDSNGLPVLVRVLDQSF